VEFKPLRIKGPAIVVAFVVRYLSDRPALIGLTFGIEKGDVIPLKMFGQPEYVGRAINVACRLQTAVKDRGRPPVYDALVTNRVIFPLLVEYA
jgi:hypothetical protein